MIESYNIAKLFLEKGKASTIAFIVDDDNVTFGDFRQKVAAWTGGLIENGLKPGDRVAILSDNSLFFVLSYFAIIAARGVVVPLSSLASNQQMALQISQTEPRFSFVSSENILLFLKSLTLIERQNYIQKIWYDCGQVEDKIANLISHPVHFECADILNTANAAKPLVSKLDDLVAIMYTSGSTGTPRGVQITSNNLLVNSNDIIKSLGITSEHRAGLVLPLHYCFGLSVLHTHLMVGASTCLLGGYKIPEEIINKLERYQVHAFYGVPSTYQTLLRYTSFQNSTLSSISFFAQAGGYLPPVFIKKIHTSFPKIPFIVMYGQTEATARLSILPQDASETKRGSIGKGLENIRLKVVRKDGEQVAFGEIGEIVATGSSISPGYWKLDKESKERFRAGNLWTGDLATVDAEGFIFIKGRKQDFVKPHGVRVSCQEVEDVICQLSGVDAVAVIGVPDENHGEALIAFVASTTNKLTERHVIKYCKSHLSMIHVPAQIRLVDSLPLNSGGKVAKSSLVAHFLENDSNNSIEARPRKTARNIFNDALRTLKNWLKKETPKHVSISRRSGSEDLFLIFTGRAGRLMMNPIEFFEKTSILGRNIVMFTDNARDNYQSGLSTDISTIRKTLEYISSICATFTDIKRIYCVGVSAGAPIAMLTGVHLNAKAVWAFGPPQTVMRCRTGEKFDLRALLSECDGETQYFVYYSEGHHRDRTVAESFVGLSDVTLIKKPGDKHVVVKTLAHDGDLKNLFPEPLSSSLTQTASKLQSTNRITETWLLEIIRDVIAVDKKMDVTRKLELHSALDSLLLLTLFSEIEKSLGWQLQLEKIVRNDIETPMTLLAFIQREVANGTNI